jgi:hypothetical protein
MTALALALVTLGGGGLLVEPIHTRHVDAASHRTVRGHGRSRPGRDLRAIAVPRTFDALFAQHGHGIPVAYLRALAWHESRLDPTRINRTSTATGVFQVPEVMRAAHNRRFGTAYTRDDLLDPAVNVAIATAAIRQIATSLAKHHPDVPNLREAWDSDRFVELVTIGWAAGWSERAGIGRVVAYLEQLGVRHVTAELVHQHARTAGASRHLFDSRPLRFCQSVARQYAADRARDADAPCGVVAAAAATDGPPVPACTPAGSGDDGVF